MEQEEAELKKTHARALKDRDAIWSKIKLYLFEKRKNNAEGIASSASSNENNYTEATLKPDKRESAEIDPSEFIKEVDRELEQVKSYVDSKDDWCSSFSSCSSSSSSLLDCVSASFEDESLELKEIFEVDDFISPIMAPGADEETSSNYALDDDDDDTVETGLWEQRTNKSFAGFSSVEKQDQQAPNPSTSLPISIQRKNTNSLPSQTERSSKVGTTTESDHNIFYQGLVVDSKYKSFAYSDKSSSFSVPKKRMGFL